jgi:hypothetical protein
MSDRIHYCTECGQDLDSSKAVWLELNSHTGRWSRSDGECPASESQGWFIFGAACAKKVLREQRTLLPEVKS